MPGRMERHATGWENIFFANHVFDKQLISRTYKELLGVLTIKSSAAILKKEK